MTVECCLAWGRGCSSLCVTVECCLMWGRRCSLLCVASGMPLGVGQTLQLVENPTPGLRSMHATCYFVVQIKTWNLLSPLTVPGRLSQSPPNQTLATVVCVHTSWLASQSMTCLSDQDTSRRPGFSLIDKHSSCIHGVLD